MVVVLLAVTGRKRKEQVRKRETSQKSPATSHVSLARQVRPMAFPILKENLRKQSFFFFLYIMRNLYGQTFIIPVLWSLFHSLPRKG